MLHDVQHVGISFSGKLLPSDARFKAKMNQSDFGCGSVPGPAGRAYSAISDRTDPLAGTKGTYF